MHGFFAKSNDKNIENFWGMWYILSVKLQVEKLLIL